MRFCSLNIVDNTSERDWYLENKRQKPAPKHYCLGMILHHVSGFSAIVGALNILGNWPSLFTTSNMKFHRPNFRKIASACPFHPGFDSVYSTVVWDNIDFHERCNQEKRVSRLTNAQLNKTHLLQPLHRQASDFMSNPNLFGDPIKLIFN